MKKLLYIGGTFVVATTLYTSFGGNIKSPKLFQLRNYQKNQIEFMFNSRLQKEFPNIKEKLTLFGYNFFTYKSVPQNLGLPVPEDYTLGPGDEIFLYFIGTPPNNQIPPVLKVYVDRDGKIYIPNLGVFYCVGLTPKELEQILSKQLGVQIKVSLGKLRTFPVYVSGEVLKPGPIFVTGVNSLIDALSLAGGVKKTGTLRNIIISRPTAEGYKRIKVDLYQILIEGKPINLRLKDGDVILVNPIGPVAAIAGYVRRPAIYELTGKEKVKDLLHFAGGVLPSATPYRITLQRFLPNGDVKVIEGSLTDEKFLNIPLKDGDLLVVRQTRDLPDNAIFVKGEIAIKGILEWKKGLKLSQILIPDVVLPNTNLNYAEIERYNPKTLKLEKIIVFEPIKVLNKEWDITLQPLDKIIFYSKYVYPPVKITGEVVEPTKIPYHPGMTLADALAPVKFEEDIKKLKAVVISKNQKITVYLDKLLLQRDQSVNIQLKPGAEVIIKRVKPQEVVEKVIVAGYVKRPGVYPISGTTTLYDILKEAGGFRRGAYPKGIVILRKSIARMQREKLSKAILLLKQELEKEEAGIMQADITKEQMRAYKYAFESKRRLLSEMEKTQITGRLVGIVVPPNLEALKDSPYNITLEDGDQIYVPKVPSAVLVFGEVYNPSAIVYRPGLTVRDYIQLAGGFTKYADIENVFVIKANGIAISSGTDRSLIEWDSKQKRFIWGMAYNDILDYKLEPGDAIIVPTKVKIPTFWRPLIKDVVQIIYQSALTVYTISKL